jgi:hypothetical protein
VLDLEQGPVTVGVLETLETIERSAETAGRRSIAVALVGELDGILATADHSPSHSAQIAAQLRQTLGELTAVSAVGDGSWFFTGDPPATG